MESIGFFGLDVGMRRIKVKSARASWTDTQLPSTELGKTARTGSKVRNQAFIYGQVKFGESKNRLVVWTLGDEDTVSYKLGFNQHLYPKSHLESS